MSNILISCIIPVKDINDPKLEDLVASIRSQDFPQDQIEILIETEGDSEQAKANGIRKAKGEICAMFCADNMIMDDSLFKNVYASISCGQDAVYPSYYYVHPKDNSLNRYFSLIGGNDPVCWFLGKNDRDPHVWYLKVNLQGKYQPSFGCNGFFYRSSILKLTDLDHYYPMDNAKEFIALSNKPPMPLDSDAIWHRTSDNLISFLKKRYRYARTLFCDRQDRRWKMVSRAEDIWRLLLFSIATATVIPSVWVSIRGFSKVRDWAWFWHWPVSMGFLITYTILVIRNLFKYGRPFQCRQPQSLSPLWDGQRV